MQRYRKDPDAIARLSPEQYRVTQQGATEYPGTGEHLYNVMMKINGKQILLDKHTGEEVTYVGVIAAEKDGQFMVDLRYMK